MEGLTPDLRDEKYKGIIDKKKCAVNLDVCLEIVSLA
jgi:hypothetical protein